MKTASRLDNVSEYYFARKLAEIARMNAEGKKVINLGIGNPDLPPHPSVIELLTDTAKRDDIHGYQGYRGIEPLRKAFAGFYSRKYGVALEHNTEILPLAGSKEGIVHISMTYLQPGDKVLIPDPGYPAYSAAALLAGAECVTYSLTPENEWLPDLNTISKMDLSDVKIMWLNYPNMPTGRRAEKEMFRSVIEFAADNSILVCHDNPYSMILNESPLSILSIPGAKDHALELNSLSKSFNLAGWRVGALISAKHHIDNVLRFKSNLDSGMFYALQSAAAYALELPDEWFESLNSVYRARKKEGLEILQRIGCSAEENQSGFFIWARIPENEKDSYTFTDRILLEANVFITPGSIFGKGGERYIRLSLCSPEQILNESLERVSKLK